MLEFSNQTSRLQTLIYEIKVEDPLLVGNLRYTTCMFKIYEYAIIIVLI